MWVKIYQVATVDVDQILRLIFIVIIRVLIIHLIKI